MTHREAFRLFPHAVFLRDAEEVCNELQLEHLMLPQRDRANPPSNCQTLPEFAPLCKLVHEEIQIIADEYYCLVRDTYRFEIVQMWMNELLPGESTHVHTHHNVLFSGVFYLKGESAHPPIVFDNPFHNHFALQKASLNEGNCETWTIQCKTGRMLIFPSYLRHWVPTNTAASSRWSVAFNIMARGRYATEDSLQSVEI